MRFLILILFLVFISCSDEVRQLPDNNLFIGQSGDFGYSIDNIEIHANSILVDFGVNATEAYIQTTFKLSDDNANTEFVISGAYNDPLSSSDLANLSSIGLTGVDLSSTKGHLRGMSKNPAADRSLAYNIRVNSILYSNPGQTVIITNTPIAFLRVGGENFYNSQFLTQVADSDYYLFHEWQSNELSAYELLPEKNFRKISLGAPSTQSEFNELEFSKNMPKVNDHEVGYTYSAEAGKNVYKVTNDGSGIQGWSFNNMGAGFGIDRWFVTAPTTANGEAVLMTASRLGNNSEFMSVGEWTGSAWSFTDLGAAAKTALGGTWVDANTYHSKLYKHEDNSIWVALNEGSSTINDSTPLQPHNFVNGYLVGMQYISGDPKILTNWNLSLVSFSGAENIMKTRFRALYFSYYDNEDNLTAYIVGDGILKLSRVNGVSTVKAVAVFEGSDFLDQNQDFPLVSTGVQQKTKYMYSIADIKDNSFEVLIQGPTSVFKLDTRTDTITEVYSNTDGTIIKQSR